jgi:hypothetical protein
MLTKLISERAALNGLMFFLSLAIIFHVLVMTGQIDYANSWGGRIDSRSDMLLLESISIIVNILMLVVVWASAGYLPINVPQGLLKACFWAMFLLFGLNTLGNLLASGWVEQVVGSIVTFMLCILSLRMATAN